MLRGAACGESSAAQKASPSVAPVQHTWNQDLTLAGDVNGHMTGIVADVGTQTSACTGAKPRPGQTWSNKFYGTVDASGAVWGIDFVIQNYGGPGTYDTRAVAVQLHSTDETQVWQNTAHCGVGQSGLHAGSIRSDRDDRRTAHQRRFGQGRRRAPDRHVELQSLTPPHRVGR